MALLIPGDIVMGRYAVQELVVVDETEERYCAEHTDLGHLVQLKCFIGEARSTQLARFERSARMMARVRDRRVVSLLDYGVHKGVPTVVLEWVEGRTVRSILNDTGPLQWPDALEVTESLLEAVATLHAASVLHRHLRPASVYLMGSSKEIKLSDLGLAKPLWQQDSTITAVGKVVGTPIYMSPEQLDLEAADERSDTYSAALILYEMLTGNIPEGSRTRLALARRMMLSEPSAPVAPKSQMSIPPAVARAVQRGLARDPDARFQSAKEFGEALRRLRRSSGPLEPRSHSAANVPNIPLWRTTAAPPRRTRVLRLQLTTADEHKRRQSLSARASTWKSPESQNYPVRALVACKVVHDADSLTRGQVELILQQYGDSYRVSDTAWIGAVRGRTAAKAEAHSEQLVSALHNAIGDHGAVVVEVGVDAIDVPAATLAGQAPPTVEMMRLLDRVAAKLNRG